MLHLPTSAFIAVAQNYWVYMYGGKKCNLWKLCLNWNLKVCWWVTKGLSWMLFKGWRHWAYSLLFFVGVLLDIQQHFGVKDSGAGLLQTGKKVFLLSLVFVTFPLSHGCLQISSLWCVCILVVKSALRKVNKDTLTGKLNEHEDFFPLDLLLGRRLSLRMTWVENGPKANEPNDFIYKT